MKPKSDKQLAEEIEAREKLERRGYRRIQCTSPTCIQDSITGRPCFTCSGKGYTWEAPLIS